MSKRAVLTGFMLGCCLGAIFARSLSTLRPKPDSAASFGANRRATIEATIPPDVAESFQVESDVDSASDTEGSRAHAAPTLAREATRWSYERRAHIRDIVRTVYDDPALGELEMLNRLTTSRDPHLEALGLELKLMVYAKEAATEVALRSVRIGSLSRGTITAAQFLAEVADTEVRAILEQDRFDFRYPESWAIDLSLAMLGQPRFLDDWGMEFIAQVDRASRGLSDGDLGFALKASELILQTHTSHAIEDALRSILDDARLEALHGAAAKALARLDSQLSRAHLLRLSPAASEALERLRLGLPAE